MPSLWFFVSWPLSLRSSQVCMPVLFTAWHEWEKVCYVWPMDTTQLCICEEYEREA